MKSAPEHISTKKKFSRLFGTRSKGLTLLLIFVAMFIPTSSEFVLRSRFQNKVSQNVYFMDFKISGFQKDDFQSYLSKRADIYKKLEVEIESQSFTVNLDEIDFKVNYEKSWKNVYIANKPYLNNPLNLFIFSSSSRVDVYPDISYNKSKLDETINNIVSLSLKEPLYEEVFLNNGSVDLSKGVDGFTITKTEFENQIINALQTFRPSVNVLPNHVDSTMPKEMREQIILTAKNLVGKEMVLKIDDKLYTLLSEKLIKTLNDIPGRNINYTAEIVEETANYFYKEPKNSIFVFEEGRVSEFVPSGVGTSVDLNILRQIFIDTRDKLAKSQETSISVDLPHKDVNPEITTENVNNLGIKEKIGSGNSYFRGSIAARVHNIILASSKFNGVLIAPGEVVSFNKILGDVSKFTGFQQAYIIRDGQTVLGDGGGVCQVSTTLFRAVLNSGLPVIERRAHSYRVAYYEQGSPAGLDATVFDPTTDFKFKNDTENYILIQTAVSSKNRELVFDLYGTRDGRVSTISKPITREVSPPPEDLYIDDPTLPAGVIKQIDYKAYGAKIYFNYKVERNGTVFYEKTFYSNYQPWQAKYLRGVGN